MGGGLAAGDGLTRQRCLWIGAAGMVVLSPDSLLLRLAQGDVAALVTLRSLFSLVTLVAVIAAVRALRRGSRPASVLWYGGFYALGLVCFPLSIKNTHVANTLVILSAAPMLAAVGGAVLFGWRTRRATWVAAAVIFVGMAAIFADDVGGDGVVGDLLALVCAVCLAATSIVVRRFPNEAVYPGLLVGGGLAAAAMAPFADWGAVSVSDVAWMAVDGAGVLALSFLLIVTAARGLPPAEVNLLFLLETLLGPLWVWLVLGETPPAATMAAGGLIGVTLALHAVWVAAPLERRRE